MNARTSQTDPIEVDWLPEGLAGMPGRLGMTFAPGKTSSSQFGKPWNRDLDADLDRLAGEYETDCLVTLVEEFELEKLGIEALFDHANARGLDVYWLPIRDSTVPTDEADVVELTQHILTRIYRGERVVAHCRGGLGRSGTIVGCCLRALEYEPEAAVEWVRRSREGAIETRHQEEFVEDFHHRWELVSTNHETRIWERLEELEGFEIPASDISCHSRISRTHRPSSKLQYFPADRSSTDQRSRVLPRLAEYPYPCEDEILTDAALRFRGYAYEQESGFDWGGWPPSRYRAEGTSLDPLETCALCFRLQRRLYKGMGTSSRTSPIWWQFRETFLRSCAVSIPEQFRNGEWYSRWPSDRPALVRQREEFVRAIHESTDYEAIE